MKTFNEKMWDLLVEYALAEGICHSHFSSEDAEFLEVIDINGKKGRWFFNKKIKEITLLDVE